MGTLSTIILIFFWFTAQKEAFEYLICLVNLKVDLVLKALITNVITTNVITTNVITIQMGVFIAKKELIPPLALIKL